MSGKLVNVLVDEMPIKVGLGHTVLQTCGLAGVEIPRFCYHDKLLIAGNCRICLVEVVGSKKLLAACAVHATHNMIIFSNTARVRLARQNVLEFLLVNHPLDCPICDQGGECDLQDITAVFGADRGRFYETEKRAVLNKDFGPLIRTSMNRCIHCTRCVRFLTLSSGFAMLGTVGRGSSTEISTYVGKFIDDELSGNITDLCPVGALTSKPYSFKARSWELTSVESFDVFDTLNSQVLFDVSANKISRVLPYANDSLNECWLTNRARYAYDGLFAQRLSSCLLRASFFFFIELGGFYKLKEFYIKLSWSSAILFFFEKLLSSHVPALLVGFGEGLDLGASIVAKFFFDALGASIFVANLSVQLSCDFTFLYLFNTSLNKLSKLPSFCLLVGLNPRLEAPLLNFRLNRLVSTHKTPIYCVGAAATYLAYKNRYLANNIMCFFQIMEFKHNLCKNFYIGSFASLPLVLVGQTMLTKFGDLLLTTVVMEFLARLFFATNLLVFDFSKLLNFNAFGVISTYSSWLHASDSGLYSGVRVRTNLNLLNTLIQPKYWGAGAVFYSLSADFAGLSDVLFNTFSADLLWTVYQGAHGNGIARAAHLVLPVLTYVESTVLYKNLLGISNKSGVVVSYNFTAKTHTAVLKLMLNVVNTQKLFGFTSLNFLLSVGFNWSLFLVSEDLLTSGVIRPWVCTNKQLYSFSEHTAYFYLQIYKAFFLIENYGIFLFSVTSFYSFFCLFTPIRGTLAPISSTILNYYSDPNLVLLAASKTMNVCSSLILKKNLSFNTLYR